MSYFKAEMHQIRLRLGSAPDALWELTALPKTPYMDLRQPTSKGKGRGKEREGRDRDWEGRCKG